MAKMNQNLGTFDFVKSKYHQRDCKVTEAIKANIAANHNAKSNDDCEIMNRNYASLRQMIKEQFLNKQIVDCQSRVLK